MTPKEARAHSSGNERNFSFIAHGETGLIMLNDPRSMLEATMSEETSGSRVGGY